MVRWSNLLLLILASFCTMDAACAEEPFKPDPEGLLEPGRWRKYRPRAESMTAEEKAEYERLESIGYLSGVQSGPEQRGVTTHDEKRTSQGLNFYCSGHDTEAVLMDMNGDIVHTWKKGFREAWPDHPLGKLNPNQYFFRRCHLYPNGDILAIFEALGIVKLDKDSKVIWALANYAHHDMEVMPNGDIWLLTNKIWKNPNYNKDRMIREDYLTLLDPDGKVKQEVSLLAAFQKSEFEAIWNDETRYADMFKDSKPKYIGDLFHTNSLQLLDGRIAAEVPEFAAGNFLLSMGALSVLAVLDLKQEQIIWAKKGDFLMQHDPQILDNGHMMVFDNLGKEPVSRVVEYTPKDMKVTWEYSGNPNEPFFTKTCGTAQRLPNGNTLITESDNGRVIEITPKGEIVWEYLNPSAAAENPEYIAVILDMIRLPKDYPAFLKETVKN